MTAREAESSTLKVYYQLTKPGIIYGNAMTAAAGYFLAARGHIGLERLAAMLVGICLVMASGCVYNNYLDRELDRAMARTRKRALVTGRISGQAALSYGSVLGVLGAVILAVGANLTTAAVAVAGWVVYVALYGIGKRRSVHGTVVGSVAGAVPPLVGYLAVRGHFDAGAILVFAALALWQMPHFYAIAIYRAKEYAAAKVPVLPLERGVLVAKRYIVGYILAFTAAAALLSVFGYAGYIYRVVMILVGISWLYRALQGFRVQDDDRWARGLFGYSLIVLIIFSVALAVGPLLP